MKWVLIRLRFILGPISLWYIRKGVRLICPSENEYELYQFNQWLNAPENYTRLQTNGKDMETKRQIAKEITERKRELIPSGNNGKISASDPIYKKRSHIWMYASCHVLLLVFVVGWSRWSELQIGYVMKIFIFLLPFPPTFKLVSLSLLRIIYSKTPKTCAYFLTFKNILTLLPLHHYLNYF